MVMQPTRPVPGLRSRNDAPRHRKGPAGPTSAISPDFEPPSLVALVLCSEQWLLQLEPQERRPGCVSHQSLVAEEPQSGKSLTVHYPWAVKERDGEVKHGLSPQGTPPKWRNEAALHAQM